MQTHVSLPRLTKAIFYCRVFCLAGALIFHFSSAFAAVPAGYLDVTTVGADPTGKTDSTAALQSAINQGRDGQLALWFPPGEYLVSARLEADQADNTRENPCMLFGSTVDPARRAVIVLAENSPGFQDPAQRRAVLHFFNKGPADQDSGNTDLYHQALVGIDFRILPGNDGAVAVRMQGAEGCTIQDVRIDLTRGGHTGIWGIPGSGGTTHDVRVLGGRVGIDTVRFDNPDGGGGSQPQPVVTGAELVGQSDFAVRGTTRGALVLVGCHIVRKEPGPVIWLKHHWSAQPFDASLQLVDSIVDYEESSPLNTVIQMHSKHTGRSFVLTNTFVRNAAHVYRAEAPGNPDGWMHFKRLAVALPMPKPNWAGEDQLSEPIYVNGSVFGDLLNESTANAVPPDGLLEKHRLPAKFPTWETQGMVDVSTLGIVGDGETDVHDGLQAAIDKHEMLFLPKGRYMVSKTLQLQARTKLIGVHDSLTSIAAISTLENRFAGTTPEGGDKPIIRTSDAASGETWLGFLHLSRNYPLAGHNPTSVGNYALEWLVGGDTVFRQVKVEGRAATNMRPDHIAQKFYKYEGGKKINPKHPQQDFAEGDFAWPCAEPNVQVRGNAGGRWFNFWMHGRQGLRQEVPFMRVEGTRQPIQFYHLHSQQQDSRNHFEFIDCQNFTVYGTKGEIKGAMVYYKNCRNFRHFGHSGMSSPDPEYFEPYLFRFENCDDFQISGINDTVNGGAGDKWVGGPFDRWVHAGIRRFHPIQDKHSGRETVIVPSLERPTLYLRGNPSL